jgi:YHS domain-containing protein
VIEFQKGGRGLADTICKLSGGKEGESFAGGKKKNECVVTGGAATIPVSYMGKTYFVCCSGCKEAFEENPKKIIEEYEKNKKK